MRTFINGNEFVDFGELGLIPAYGGGYSFNTNALMQDETVRIDGDLGLPSATEDDDTYSAYASCRAGDVIVRIL